MSLKLYGPFVISVDDDIDDVGVDWNKYIRNNLIFTMLMIIIPLVVVGMICLVYKYR